MNWPTFRNKKLLLVVLILAAGVIFQHFSLIENLSRDLVEVSRDMGQHGLWRSAKYSQSNRFADYVRFLNETIPTGARVVLPPDGVKPDALSSTPAMQFFLAPRQVINCTGVDCADQISAENTVLLCVGDFPGEGVVERWGGVVMFDDEWGVVLPGDFVEGETVSLAGFDRITEILLAALGPLTWLLVVGGSGFLFASAVIYDRSLVTRIILGLGLGLAANTLAVAVMSLVGISLERGTLLAATGLLFITGVAIYVVSKRRTGYKGALFYPSGRFDVWMLWIAVLGIFALLVGVGEGYHVTDEIVLWGAKGYGIAADGSILNVMGWGTNTAAYPLHWPLLIATFRTVSFEVLPGAKMLIATYYTGSVLFIYKALLWGKVHRMIAGLAALLLAGAPLVFQHATIAYANLMLAYYLVVGVVLLAASLVGQAHVGSNRQLLLAGLFFAAAAWTRPEGLAMSILCLLLLVGVALLKRWVGLSWGYLAALGVPVLVYSGMWFILTRMVYTRPVQSSGLVAQSLVESLRGNIHYDDMLYALRFNFTSFLTTSKWGALGILILAGLIVLVVFRKSLTPYFSLVTIAGGMLVLATYAMYYASSYETVHDTSWWVSTGLDRMLFPGVMLLWLGIIGLVGLSIKPPVHSRSDDDLN